MTETAKTIIESAPLFVDDETKSRIASLQAEAHDIESPDRIKALNQIMQLKTENFDEAAARAYVNEKIVGKEPLKPSRLQAAKDMGHAAWRVLNTPVSQLF